MRILVLISFIATAILACLVSIYPEVCLRIPTIGFAFYALITGKTAPYFSMECYKLEEFKHWTRDGDVFVSTLPKSGTTWMLYVSHLIRVHGDDTKYPFHEINTVTPWPTLIHKPGQTWSEVKTLLNTTILPEGIPLASLWNNVDYPFRIFKAHETPLDSTFPIPNNALLPIQQYPHIKFVAMARDLPDVLASFFPFARHHKDSTRALWGGCPPIFPSPQWMITLLFNFGLPQHRVGTTFLAYYKAWWRWRHSPNVLLLHYKDVRRDLPGTVRRLASFYGVELIEAEVEDIAGKASFASMKAMKNKFNYRLWGNVEFEGGLGTLLAEGCLVRRGQDGDGAVLFSTPELEEIRRYQFQALGDDPELLHWSMHGGETGGGAD